MDFNCLIRWLIENCWLSQFKNLVKIRQLYSELNLKMLPLLSPFHVGHICKVQRVGLLCWWKFSVTAKTPFLQPHGCWGRSVAENRHTAAVRLLRNLMQWRGLKYKPLPLGQLGFQDDLGGPDIDWYCTFHWN